MSRLALAALALLATGLSMNASAQSELDRQTAAEKSPQATPTEAEKKDPTRPERAAAERSPQPATSGIPHPVVSAHGTSPSIGGAGRNLASPSPGIPPGEIHVDVLGPRGQPVGGTIVHLRTNFQSISQGNSDNVTSKAADKDGKVRFSGLDTALRFSYGIEVVRDGAKYQIPEFRLQKVGHQVVVYTYPTTTDQLEAFVASRGYAHVQLREDFYRVDVMYRVINAGQKTWLPQAVHLSLPENAQAIDTTKRAGDKGFEEVDGDVMLVGSYPPGNNDVQFSYQVPNQNTETLAFQMGVLPHLLDLTVLAQKAPGMTLTVPGFDRTETRPGPDGKPALFSGKNLRKQRTPLQSITIELGGLPVIGPGRWIAAALAFLIACAGFLFASSRKKEDIDDVEAERNQARSVLLDEVLLLEQAKKNGDVGPRTYEKTRREILTALARLQPQSTP